MRSFNHLKDTVGSDLTSLLSRTFEQIVVVRVRSGGDFLNVILLTLVFLRYAVFSSLRQFVLRTMGLLHSFYMIQIEGQNTGSGYVTPCVKNPPCQLSLCLFTSKQRIYICIVYFITIYDITYFITM